MVIRQSATHGHCFHQQRKIFSLIFEEFMSKIRSHDAVKIIYLVE